MIEILFLKTCESISFCFKNLKKNWQSSVNCVLKYLTVHIESQFLSFFWNFLDLQPSHKDKFVHPYTMDDEMKA